MACDVILQTSTYNNETQQEELQLVTVGEVEEDVDLTPQLVAEMIANQDADMRGNLARQLATARTQELTSNMVLKHQFMSNLTLGELMNKYGLAGMYSITPDLYNNHIIVQCSKINLSGVEYGGRVVDCDGREIFLIRNQYDAVTYMKYLQAREMAEKILGDPHNVPENLQPYMDDLDAIVAHSHETTGRVDAVVKYLSNRNYFPKPFVHNGKTISPRQVLGKIVQTLTGEYTADIKHTPMEIALDGLRVRDKSGKGKSQTYDWLIYGEDLFDVLKAFNPDNEALQDMTLEQFSELSTDELTELCLGPDGLFMGNPKLERAKISPKLTTRMVPVTERTTRVKTDALRQTWNDVIQWGSQKGIEVPKWSEFHAKKNSKKMMDLFNSLDYEAAVVNEHLDGSTVRKIQARLSNSDTIEFYYKEEGVFTKKELKLDVRLSFPYSSIESIYNHGYDEQYLYSPCTAEDNDRIAEGGKYNGMNIYKGVDKNKNPIYLISRNLISVKSYMAAYPTLEGAMYAIDQHFDNDPILANSLLSIKQRGVHPRTADIEMKGLMDGQILTVLDYQLPKFDIDELPQIYKTLLGMTVKEFQTVFKGLYGIEKLNTPEKAATFIIEIRNRIPEMQQGRIIGVGTPEFLANSIIRRGIGKDTLIQVINNIDKAGTINYYVESTYTPSNEQGKWHNPSPTTLRYLPADVADLTKGKVGDTDIQKFIGQTLTDAVSFLNDKFGIGAQVMTLDELKTFSSNNNLELEDKMEGIRAFIYNGQVFINGSKANAFDLFHEVGHLLLGVAKVKYNDGYKKLIETYQKRQAYPKRYTLVSKEYENFGESDWVEETVADLIARDIMRSGRLAEGYDDEWFSATLQGIMDTMDDFKSTVPDNGLGFNGFMKELIQETGSSAKKERAVSYLIHQSLENGKITANCK